MTSHLATCPEGMHPAPAPDGYGDGSASPTLNWVDKYIMLTFVDGGRSPCGVDCWGLICLAYWQELGVELPRFSHIKGGDIRGISSMLAKHSGGEGWKPIELGQEVRFDVVVMRSRGEIDGKLHSLPLHVGIITIPGYVMHIEEGFNVMHMPFRNTPTMAAHPAVKNRVLSIHRYNGRWGPHGVS